MDGFYDEIIDDGILESLIIIGLAAALVGLVYYRNQRQQAHRRQDDAARGQQGNQPAGEGEAQQPQGQDRGLFPAPGDPEFGQWVAGGIGH